MLGGCLWVMWLKKATEYIYGRKGWEDVRKLTGGEGWECWRGRGRIWGLLGQDVGGLAGVGLGRGDGREGGAV